MINTNFDDKTAHGVRQEISRMAAVATQKDAPMEDRLAAIKDLGRFPNMPLAYRTLIALEKAPVKEISEAAFAALGNVERNLAEEMHSDAVKKFFG